MLIQTLELVRIATETSVTILTAIVISPLNQAKAPLERQCGEREEATKKIHCNRYDAQDSSPRYGTTTL